MLNRTLPYYLEDRTGVYTASDYDDIYDRLFLRVSSSSSSSPSAHPPPVSRSVSSSSTSTASSLSSSPPSLSPLAAPPAPAYPSASGTWGAPSPATPPFTISIANTGRRSSTRAFLTGQRAPRADPAPAVVLAFGRGGALGSVVVHARDGEGGAGKGRSVPMGQWLRRTGVFAGSLSRKFVGSDGREYRWVHRGVEGHEWTVRALLRGFSVRVLIVCGCAAHDRVAVVAPDLLLTSIILTTAVLPLVLAGVGARGAGRRRVVHAEAAGEGGVHDLGERAHGERGVRAPRGWYVVAKALLADVLMVVSAEILASLTVMRHIAAFGL